MFTLPQTKTERWNFNIHSVGRHVHTIISLYGWRNCWRPKASQGRSRKGWGEAQTVRFHVLDESIYDVCCAGDCDCPWWSFIWHGLLLCQPWDLQPVSFDFYWSLCMTWIFIFIDKIQWKLTKISRLTSTSVFLDFFPSLGLPIELSSSLCALLSGSRSSSIVLACSIHWYAVLSRLLARYLVFSFQSFSRAIPSPLLDGPVFH